MVSALATLPQLASLYMSLFEEAAVHLIISRMPRLQYLNGIEIQRGTPEARPQDCSGEGELPLEQIRETDEEESAAPVSIVGGIDPYHDISSNTSHFGSVSRQGGLPANSGASPATSNELSINSPNTANPQ